MIRLTQVNLNLGPKEILKQADLTVHDGHKLAVVGANGAGKSTLFKLILGQLPLDQGDLSMPKNWRMAYMAQEVAASEQTALDYVLDGHQEFRHLQREMEKAEQSQDDLKLAALHGEFELVQGYDVAQLGKTMLAGLGFKPQKMEDPVSAFSGGWRMRLNLAKALIMPSDLLLLDEPTNHLDAESVLWLEQHLSEYKGTVIAITHDRYFLDNVAGWILELDRGEGIPWKGNYSAWLEQKSKRLAQEEKTESKRRKTLERELEWVRMSPKGRRTKSKSRLSNYEKLLGSEGREKEDKIELYIPPGPRLGTNVIDAEKVSKAFGDKLLYENLEFKLPPAGIVGIIGPNGAGKTTLFRMIMGQETADSGTFKVGETVKIAYVDQQHVEIDMEKTIWEQITGGQEQVNVGGKLMNSRAYVAKFNFNGSDQNKKIGVLSGGERNRLH